MKDNLLIILRFVAGCALAFAVAAFFAAPWLMEK
jgi:hypothetical protein